MEKVFVSGVWDYFYDAHANILREAAEYGDVVVGVLTDDACIEINDLPHFPYKHRESVIKSNKYVKETIPQNTAVGIKELKKSGAKIVVHGDNWKNDQVLKPIRDEILNYLNSIGGELIEIPYSYDLSSLCIKENTSSKNVTSSTRLRFLRRLLSSKKHLRFVEVHNPISGIIVERERINGKIFDGMWSSSLTDSTSNGKPDIEVLESSSRLNSIDKIFSVTSLPLIYDGDTGGKPEHFQFLVKDAERIGISAVIIEDKCGLKKNSLLGTEVHQEQDSIENFSYKIRMGKEAQTTKEFMIIARIESLILGKDIEDALERSDAYIKAGADGVMIHSKDKDGKDILKFIEIFRKKDKITPIIVVPTTYNHITDTELFNTGANIVIHANHLLRASMYAMKKTANSILLNDRSKDTEKECFSVKEILNYITGTV